MAATVQIIEKNGAGGIGTDKTSGSVRFKNADNATVDLNNPLVKPTSGYDYAFDKWLRLNVTGGSYSDISNIRAYSDGGNGLGTGVEVYAKATTSYATPAEGADVTGFSDLFGYTSGSPLDLGGDGSTGAGEKGDHLQLRCRIDNTVSGGVTPSETLTIAWDEI